MPRPRTPGEKKTGIVTVQMTPSMKKAIERRARKAEVTVGHWCRGAFKKELTAPQPSPIPEEART